MGQIYIVGVFRITRSGGSLKLTIPKAIARKMGVENGTEVDVKYDEETNTLLITPILKK